MILLGLAGLYQNWLLHCLEPLSTIKPIDKHNFRAINFTTTMLLKVKQNLNAITNQEIIINTYVTEENYVWYLYNFFEKTDEIGVKINNITNDLFTKSPGTPAFNDFLIHFQNTYNLSKNDNLSLRYNSLVEYFYLILTEKQSWKSLLTYTRSDKNWINIEYNDFTKKEILISRFSKIDNFNLTHFEKCYKMLVDRNRYYLYRKDCFLTNLENLNLDILETAYAGYLLSLIKSERLDWYNEDFRNKNISENKKLIKQLHIDVQNKNTVS